MSLVSAIAASISSATGEPFRCLNERALGGGCINQAQVLEGAGRRYFVKLNRAARRDMFEAEAAGLQEIADSKTVRVPRPICCAVQGDQAYLVLEYLPLGGRDAAAAARLGQQLAAMHRHTAPQFGWRRDNTIGSTPQPNRCDDDWPRFYRDQRLGFQLSLAERNGYSGTLQRRGETLLSELPAFFSDYRPQPSLLHGDLWGGNFGVLDNGEPVIFDPAVYFGDREADLAMTELFGGFGSGFYRAYDESYPLDSGYAVRKTLYNLYHVLNHLNLFGGGYRSQAENMLEQLLSEVR